MTIQKIQNTNRINQTFTSAKKDENSNKLSVGRRIGIGATTALGVGAALAGMAKLHKYPIIPKDILKKPFKDTFLGKKEYFEKEIIAMAVGSCAGGLAGGAIFDKKENLPAKCRESVVQLANAATPILFVGAGARLADKATPKIKEFVKPMFKNIEMGAGVKKFLGATPKIAASLTGLAVGMYAGNRLSHLINTKLFGAKDDRPVALSDLCAHGDDLCEVASFISTTNPVVHAASRFIPVAMLVPGIETGKAQEKAD